MGLRTPEEANLNKHFINGFNENDFIESVFKNQYVLVVGKNAILRKEYNGGNVDKYIREQIGSRYSISDGVDLKRRIRELLLSKEWEYAPEEWSTELESFLRTKMFRAVLTTTYDGYLEEIMKRVWGENGFDIYNISDSNKLKNLLASIQEGKEIKPFLFYIFGKADERADHNFIVNDIDAIKMLSCWISKKGDSEIDLSPFLDFLKKKNLLSLGCGFDDWYFRFFWYGLRGGDVNSFINSGVVISETDVNGYNGLSNFLDKNNSYVIDGDAHKFMETYSVKLTKVEPNSQIADIIRKKRHEDNMIFISYKHDDFRNALWLFLKLKDAGFKVWIDSKNLYEDGNNRYHEVITNSISECKVFLALLTPRVQKDLEEPDFCSKYENADTKKDITPWYPLEWKLVRQYEDKEIIPIAMNGYNCKNDVHRFFNDLISKKTAPSTIDLMDSESSFKSLKEKLDKVICNIK